MTQASVHVAVAVAMAIGYINIKPCLSSRVQSVASTLSWTMQHQTREVVMLCSYVMLCLHCVYT